MTELESSILDLRDFIYFILFSNFKGQGHKQLCKARAFNRGPYCRGSIKIYIKYIKILIN